MKVIKWILAICCALWVSTGSIMAQDGVVQAPELPVQTFTLANGLKVIVLEQAGVTSFTATFLHGAGVAREWQGLRGSAHLVADALLGGTTRVGTKGWRQERTVLNELDRLDKALADAVGERARADDILKVALDARIENIRADMAAAMKRHAALIDANAWLEAYRRIGAEGPTVLVDHDAIAYSVTLPSTALDRFASLEQARASDLITRTFYRDRARLIDTWSTPQGASAVLGALASTAYDSHPYGRYQASPTQLAGIDRGELGFYLRTFTAPSRTVLAIVGGVKASVVRSALGRTLGRVSGGNPAAELEGLESPQAGPRRAVITRAQAPELVAGFHVPQAHGSDGATLSVMMELLGHPTDGLIKQVQRLSGLDGGQVSASFFPAGGPLGPRDPPLLVLGMELPPDSACSAEAALYYSLAVLATDGPPVSALVAAKAGARDQISALFSDHARMAPALAWAEVAEGDPRGLLSRYDHIADVSAAHIKALATTLFDPDNRTSVLAWPAGSGAYDATCTPRALSLAR